MRRRDFRCRRPRFGSVRNRSVSSAPPGFTLVEVIVALLVLELGLLGVAGLALRALQLLSESSARSRAAVAVEEVVDSLAASGVGDGGFRRFEGGTVEWSPEGARPVGIGASLLEHVTIVARGSASDDPVLTVRAILPGR